MEIKENPTLKNTKSEILSAYSQLLKEIEDKKDIAAENSKVKKTSTKISTILDKSERDIIHDIADLKSQTNDSLENLSKLLVKEREKLVNIKDTISTEEDKLQDMHGIIANANSLEALLLAQQRKKEEFDKWLDSAKEKFTNEMEEKKSSWHKEQTKYEQEFKDKKILQEKEWKRTNEEYEYQKQINRKKDEDECTDKKKLLEQEYLLREEKIATSENELKELKIYKEKAEKLLQDAIASNEKDLRSELEKQFKMELQIQEKEYKSDTSLLKQNITYLTEKIAEQQVRIKSLNENLLDARNQSQELAQKVIEGNIKIREIHTNTINNDKIEKPVK